MLLKKNKFIIYLTNNDQKIKIFFFIFYNLKYNFNTYMGNRKVKQWKRNNMGTR